MALIGSPVWLFLVLSGRLRRESRELMFSGVGGVLWGLFLASLISIAFRPWGEVTLIPFAVAILAGLATRLISGRHDNAHHQDVSAERWEERSSLLAADIPLGRVTASMVVRSGRFPSLSRTRSARQ